MPAPPSRNARPAPTVSVGPLWGLWIFFVVYGSLVPLEYRAIPLDVALERFSRLPMLDVGVTERADWIANGVLYLPVGFLTAVLLARHTTSTPARLLAGLLALVFSVALALAVEFVQLYFPQRTVSLNDVYAECIGGSVGAAVAVWWGPSIRRLALVLAGSAHLTPARAGVLYLALYVVYSLFPYDLLLSSQEVANKLDSDLWGWVVADSIGARPLVLAGSSIVEIVLAVPLGMLFALWARGRAPIARALLGGIALGCLLELAQFFIASGVSQGWSIAMRGLGCLVGALVWSHRARLDPVHLRSLIARWTILLTLPYLLALVTFGGWFASGWGGIDFALARLANEVRFMPFYYHYFTSEARAVFSLASVSMMYLPIGIAGWARRWAAGATVVAAVAIAAVVETGKLFVMDNRPDPTNLLIAAMAAWLVHWLLGQTPSLRTAAPAQPQALTAPISDGRVSSTSIGRRIAAGVMVAACAVWALAFPTQPILLAAGLAGYAVLVWHRPLAVFFGTAALLPMLDLAPFSGRLFLDEFDALMAVGLCVGFARLPPAPVRRRRHALLRVLGTLMALTLLIGVSRALLSAPGLDLNAFTHYLSPFNALRIAKGGLWALLLLALAMRQPQGRPAATQAFGQGLVAGLTWVVAFVLWERHSFTELLDFTNEYRITGPFSAMHTGGAYVECFLVVATPFLVHAIARSRGLAAKAAGGLLLLGASYAVMVTFSRGGYVAFAVALLVAVAGTLRLHGGARRTGLIAALMLAGSAAVALPILSGSFAQSRLASTQQDLDVRQRHWSGALALHDGDWARSVLGLGIGGFPAAHYWNSPENERTALYQLVRHDAGLALRLGSGRPLYLDQLVPLEPYTAYRLRMKLRAPDGQGRLAAALCHKWLLESQDCLGFSFSPAKPGAAWTEVSQMLNSGVLAAGPLDRRRPVKLSLHNAGQGAVEIDDLRLETADGRNLLRNGDFAGGMDHWHFTADDHLAWHVKNLPLAWYVDQGLLGLAVLVLWLAAALWRAGRVALQGDGQAAALLAALAGFLLVGVFDALLDTSRFLMLALVLSGFALALRVAPPTATPEPRA